MFILGINAFHGDASASLLRDGVLVCAVEEERFNRVKHSAGMPVLAVRHCLEEAQIDLAQVDHVAISRNPLAHLPAKVGFALRHRPDWRNLILERVKNAANVRGFMDELCAVTGVRRGSVRARLHNVEHHRAHLASAFFVSPFEHAAVLSVDGFGDFVSTMWGEGRGERLFIDGKVPFPHSLGIVYTAATQWLGFPKYGDEGKVMGLAPYGRPRYVDRFRRLARPRGEIGFELDLRFFQHHTTGVTMTWESGSPRMSACYSPAFVDLFGPPRQPGDPYTEHVYDVAASLQAWLEEILLEMIERLRRRTGLDRLCLAGGVALNSCVNGKILSRTGMREVFVQPAAGDNGTSLGAAYYVWNQVLGHPRGFVMDHAYTGPDFDGAAIARAVEQATLHIGFRTFTLAEEEVIERTATAITEGKIVGLLNGRMEFGPRALGNRSIVVDPRRADMKDILNSRIKHREAFRPFAPSILEEHTSEYFEEAYPSPAMLMVYKIREGKRGLIPAVTHVDGTGRLQTVSKRTNPRYWKLIEAFRQKTGVPIVLNTSFNENEPIVCTPSDALGCFMKTRMDVLVMGNTYIERVG